MHDQLVESYRLLPPLRNEKPIILGAPSWQVDNLLDTCINPLLESILNKGYKVNIRPHPQYIRLFPERIKALQDRYAKYQNEIVFGLDISDNYVVFSADILITDWSNTAFEFSYCTLRPCIFVNTPMKVMNPNFEQFGLEVVNITHRDKVGFSLDVSEVSELNDSVVRLLANHEDYKEQIVQVLEQYLYYQEKMEKQEGNTLLVS